MRQYLHIGHVIQFGNEKDFHVVVYMNESAAKIVALNKRDWRDPDLVIEESELGDRLTAGLCYNDCDYVKFIGQFCGEIKQRQKVEYKDHGPLGTVLVPFPGSIPKKKRGSIVSKTVIPDDGFAQAEIDQTMELLQAGAKGFAAMFLSPRSNPPSEEV